MIRWDLHLDSVYISHFKNILIEYTVYEGKPLM